MTEKQPNNTQLAETSEQPEFCKITLDNLEQEHICCAISDKKTDVGVAAKKAWLQQRIPEGLTFLKLDVRGKVFIEYLPTEQAWCPIEAAGYLWINCFWVAGRYSGQGYGAKLLEQCFADAKAQGKQGVAVLSSKKKRSFLSDPAYLKRKGFLVADTAAPDFELLYFPLCDEHTVPHFKACAKEGRIEQTGWVLYYTAQCPHTAKYVPLLQEAMAARGLTLHLCFLDQSFAAQNAPCPFTTYSLFYNGQFITNEILSEKSLAKLLLRLSK